MADDVGLFGPDSVTWKLHSEPILMLGGLRSLYLQALHPRAVAGVSQNSGYRADPWGRLMRTSDYVGTVVYGSTTEARQGPKPRSGAVTPWVCSSPLRTWIVPSSLIV